MNESGFGIGSILRYLADKKTLGAAAVILILGVLLMLFGHFDKDDSVAEDERYSTDALEKKVETLCEGVAGVGRVRVMITVDTVSEKLYAKNSQHSAELSRTEYVTTTGGLMPTGERAMTVRGVAVVCGGGDDMEVRLKLTELICALFDIGADCVSVVGGK